MKLNINSELKFKFKKTLEKKFKEWDFDFQNINNINLITHDEFMNILINKFTEFDLRFKSLLNRANIDYIKNKFSFEIAVKLWANDNKLHNPMLLYFWTNKHEEILNNFINTLKSNETFMNLLYNLIFKFIYEDKRNDNSYKLFTILKIYLLLLDPRYMIFSPSIIATKSTFKILLAKKSTISIEKAFLLNDRNYYSLLLSRFLYINNFSKHQDYLLKLQYHFFKSFQEKVISKYLENDNVKDLKIYFLKEDVYMLNTSINNLFLAEFDNIISRIYLYDSIRYLKPSEDLPYIYNLGYFYKFSLRFKYLDFDISLFYDTPLKNLLFKINNITKEFFENKFLIICKKLTANTRNEIYYNPWNNYYETTIVSLRNKRLGLYELLIEYLKPLLIMQKIFTDKNKKINYRIKKL